MEGYQHVPSAMELVYYEQIGARMERHRDAVVWNAWGSTIPAW